MSEDVISDIEAWSKTLAPWRRDCLRRLATSNDLIDSDYDALLAMLKAAAGFQLESDPPSPVPFEKSHYGVISPQPFVLKRIENIKNVNRLVSDASLNFCPKALTIVYGRNGSGKSGFVRILRTACRTRVEKPEKLKVLADVYGEVSVPQSADIIVDVGKGDIPLPWTPDGAPHQLLTQVAVFDTASAELYVDGGNHIRYLPFGLALPHRLNTSGMLLREKLEAEYASGIGNKLDITAVAFSPKRATKAQAFYASLNNSTSNADIDAASSFSDNDQARIDQITAALLAGASAVADLTALTTWLDNLAAECAVAVSTLSDSRLTALSKLKETAVAARQAATISAEALFTNEPLKGVGSESWRLLWAAARNYSLSEAYSGREFPVVSVSDGEPSCVLCQQPLQPDGIARMRRFQKYIDDELDRAAHTAEAAIADASAKIPAFKQLDAQDFAQRLDQVRKRDPKLSDAILQFQTSVVKRRIEATNRLTTAVAGEVPELDAPTEAVRALADAIRSERDALANAAQEEERRKLVSEKEELEDRKILASNKENIVIRRDLLMLKAAFDRAFSELQPRGITQRANELIDKYLTKAVVDQFDVERSNFEINHLKVALSRKSGQTKAEFDVNPQSKVTKVPSHILSEGEQRALALACFLTEVTLTEGTGPLVIDDPVSSLDRDRSIKVAARLAEEATRRQIIVFTHDIVFFNELSAAAEKQNIDPVTIALFSDNSAAGKIDPSGMAWKGLSVAKRIGKLKNDFAPLHKLQNVSPSEYEFQIKNLYGRLRDIYERVVEEIIFKDIVRRGVDVVQTQLLRYVTIPDELAIRFYEGMTLANTYSHDNPASDTVPARKPDEFNADLAELEALVAAFRKAQADAEAARPQMKK